MVKRDCMSMIFDFFGKSGRQTRKTAHLHLHREILPLNETRRNVFNLGISSNRDRTASNTFRGAVTCFTLAVVAVTT